MNGRARGGALGGAMLRATVEIAPDKALSSLREVGCALLDPTALCALAGVDRGTLEPLRSSWNALPPDEHLLDAGGYRFRRHACFTLGEHLDRVPHRAHYQPLDYNALHGGLERWFAPIEDEVALSSQLTTLLTTLGRELFALKQTSRWFIEAHQFRIDATRGMGRPTPEGAHRDGVEFVAVVLIDRVGIKGGETRVFEAEGPHGIRFTMREPWTTLLLDDARVIHETSPVQSITAGPAYRDTLVLTFRADGFQSR